MTAIFAHGKDRQVSKGEQTLSATRLTAPADYAKPAIMESSRGGCSQEAGRRRLGSG